MSVIMVPREFFSSAYVSKHHNDDSYILSEKTAPYIMADPAVHICGEIFDRAIPKTSCLSSQCEYKDSVRDSKKNKNKKYVLEHTPLKINIQAFLHSDKVKSFAEQQNISLPLSPDNDYSLNCYKQATENPNFECPISFAYLDNNAVMLSCGDIFHEDSEIFPQNTKVIKTDDKCPVCQVTVEKEPVKVSHIQVIAQYVKRLKEFDANKNDGRFASSSYQAYAKGEDPLAKDATHTDSPTPLIDESDKEDDKTPKEPKKGFFLLRFGRFLLNLILCKGCRQSQEV